MDSRVCGCCCGPIPDDRRKGAKYCCHICGERARHKKHYDLNPDHYKARRKKYDSSIPFYMISRIKHKSKKLGIPFDITVDDICIPDVCPVLGYPLRSGKGTGRWQNHSPSLDRIRPNLGYIKGNVRVISARANLLKSDATIEELEKVLEDLRRIL